MNPLAGLHPVLGDLVILAGLVGVGYEALIGSIVASATDRLGISHGPLLVCACQSCEYTPDRAMSSSWLPSSTRRPPLNTRILPAIDVASRCVTEMTVRPSDSFCRVRWKAASA